MLEAADKLIHYPDDSGTEFREAISRRFDVNDGTTSCSVPGSAELIRLFPDVFLQQGGRGHHAPADLLRVPFALKMRGASIHDLSRFARIDGFHFDIARAELHDRVRMRRLVYICNPNNPTGGMVESRKRIVEIVEECERQSTLVFLDETLAGAGGQRPGHDLRVGGGEP